MDSITEILEKSQNALERQRSIQILIALEMEAMDSTDMEDYVKLCMEQRLDEISTAQIRKMINDYE